MIAGRAGLLAHANRGRKHRYHRSVIYKDQNPPFTDWVLDNEATMQARGAQFDGITFRSSVASGASSPVVNFTAQQIVDELAGWSTANFGECDRQWFTVRTTQSRAEWDSDSDWAQMVQNFSRIAEVIGATAQIDGIAWDNEKYGGGANQWSNVTTLSDADCAALAYQRGQEMMDGMVAAWPGVRIWMAYGGWYGHWGWEDWVDPDPLRNLGVPEHNRMMWPFWCGMAKAAAGTSATLIDGGEVYTVRNPRHSQRLWFAQSSMVPKVKTAVWVQPTGATYWPPDLGDFEFRIMPAVGVYDREDALIGSGAHTEAENEEHIRLAHRRHEVLWFYAETYTYVEPQGGKASAPQSFLDAVAEGRRTGRW